MQGDWVYAHWQYKICVAAGWTSDTGFASRFRFKSLYRKCCLAFLSESEPKSRGAIDELLPFVITASWRFYNNIYQLFKLSRIRTYLYLKIFLLYAVSWCLFVPDSTYKSILAFSRNFPLCMSYVFFVSCLPTTITVLYRWQVVPRAYLATCCQTG